MPSRLPHPDSAIHLYRHLLREATYVPPYCRPWVTEVIRSKFRDDRRPNIHKAHQSLRYLRSANSGHLDRTRRLCFLASGRLGKRRRLLASSSLGKEPAESSEALELKPLFPPATTNGKETTAAASGSNRKPQPDDTLIESWLDNWDVEKIKAIAGAQVRSPNTNWPKQMRKTYDPASALPKMNAWGKPFKPQTTKRKEQKHYARVLADLMPPVPQGEWDLLQDLSMGQAEAKMFDVPTRRPIATMPVAVPNSSANTAHEWNWEAYATKPVRAVERGNSRVFKSLSGAHDTDPRGQGRPIGVKSFKPRRLRRSIYSRVWEATPILQKSKGKGKFQVTFGAARRELSPATTSDLQFFSGVDVQGARPGGTKAHKGKG
ncbi:hypothetical protein PG985_003875 [Apiospora marii]|uniref:Mitochondrial zinc maintenance protein 1, mitochondrial n=1 Tax=Apiospora marii TaxID=335849 RepID=A0ABR1SGU9_9PEZI